LKRRTPTKRTPFRGYLTASIALKLKRRLPLLSLLGPHESFALYQPRRQTTGY
jgi:hypothetical protein